MFFNKLKNDVIVKFKALIRGVDPVTAPYPYMFLDVHYFQ